MLCASVARVKGAPDAPSRALPRPTRTDAVRHRPELQGVGSLLAEWHEDRDARLRTHLARTVALPGEVLGDQDVARSEPAHRPVADLDVDGAGQREYRIAAGRVMPRVRARRREAADDDAAARDQLSALGLIAPRLEAWLDLLEMRLPVGTREDPNDGHGSSRVEVKLAGGIGEARAGRVSQPRQTTPLGTHAAPIAQCTSSRHHGQPISVPVVRHPAT